MTEPKLKISPSHIEATLEGKPHLKRYASRLQAIDKDQNGEVDMAELCEVLEELETSTRNRRLLKWVAILTGLFSLLSIAAIVGLTYAVVDLSKDTSVSNNVLVSKDTGNTLATAQAKHTRDLASLVNATPQELANLRTVILPMENNNNTQIFHVSDVEFKQGVSLTLTSPSGKSVVVGADGSISIADATVDSATQSPEGGSRGSRRRLLEGGSAQAVMDYSAADDPFAGTYLRPCSSNSDCKSGSCGRQSAMDGATLSCCADGVGTSTYGGFDYCKQMANDKLCWTSDMCASGYCFNNSAGFMKGVCKAKIADGQHCVENKECASGSCGADQAGWDYICCPPGRPLTTYWGNDYCYNMPDGKACYSDAMCASGICAGNAGGTQEGKCTSLLGPGAGCSSNSECQSGNCGYISVGGPMQCCPDGRSVGTYWANDYCYGMPSGTACYSDGMCASGNCHGNCLGTCQGNCD